MATVHFTTIPCKPTQPIRHKESHIFTIFFPVLRTLRSLGLKITIMIIMYVFMNVVKVFVCYELWVNAPGAIFFPTEYCVVFIY